MLGDEKALNVNQDRLRFLLGSFPAEEFLAEYWRSRFLFLLGAGRDLLNSMPSLARVEEILERQCVQEDRAVRFLSFTPDGKPIYRMWLVDGADATARDPHEPINILQAERSFPELEPLAQKIEGLFGAPSNLQLFYSCTGKGLRPHTDINDSFVVQVYGRKRWYVADLPRKGLLKTGNEAAVVPADAQTYELAPGDMLYKPSHAIHSTETVEGPSLSLTVSIVTRTAGQVLIEYLSPLVDSDPTWNERFPVDASDHETRRRLEAACRRLGRKFPQLEALEAWCRS